MADTIITRIVVEGGQAYAQEMQQASKSVDTLDKAQRILAQSTNGLNETQLQLIEKIKATQKALNDSKNAETTTLLSKDQLQKQLQKLVLEYERTTNEITKSTNEVTKNTNEVKKATLDSSNYSNVLKQVANGEISVREATKLLNQEYVKLKLQGKDNTDQMRQLRQVAGELKDTVGDASAEISTAGSDTRGLDKTIRAVTAVSAGFQVAEGVSALFGDENKKLQETLVKLNAVMAITNGLHQIQQELTRKDSVLYPIVTKFQKLWTLAIGETSGAMRILRVALASIGIGLIIAGIALLIQNFDKVKKAILSMFPSLDGLGGKIKDFVNNSLLGMVNGFIDAYNKSLFLRNSLEGIADVVVSLKDVFVGQFKIIGDAIGTIFKAIKAGLSGENPFTVLKEGFNNVWDEIKETGKKVVQNFTEKDLPEELKKVKAFDVFSIFNSKQNKEAGEKVGKEVGAGIKEGIETETKGAIEILEAQISSLEKVIKDIIAEDLQLGIQPSQAVQVLIQQLQELKEQLAQVNAEFEAMQTNGTEIEGGIKRVTATGEESTKELGNTIDTTLEGSKTHLESVLENAENVQDKLSPILNTFNELTQFASEIISQRAEKEITQLDRQKEEGLISERKYQREVAKIKTDAARKQRRVEVAQAYAQIPIAILSAFIGTPGGIIIKGIASGLAGAFALAQAIKLQSAPLPQFRHGVINLQRGNNPKGVDTIPAMLNEGESVMTTEETKKHIGALTAIRKGTFDKEFFNVAKLSKIVPIVNYNAISQKPIEKPENKIDINPIVEELEYIGQYIKDGNGEARQRTGQLKRISEALKQKKYA